MSQERELNHASNQAQVPPQVDIDLAPGRSSLSAKLEAPDNPVISGLIQRKAERDANGVAEGADSAIATASSSSGQSLPGDIQRKFEASLGTDLSSVRVHTGGESQSAAHAVGAKAYTMGQNIHFGAGHYDPSSSAGEHLLAHEVAHTVQQQGGSSTRQNKLEVSGPQDAAEHEADHAADAMVSGGQASISRATPNVARDVDQTMQDAGWAGGEYGSNDAKVQVIMGHTVTADENEAKVIIGQIDAAEQMVTNHPDAQIKAGAGGLGPMKGILAENHDARFVIEQYLSTVSDSGDYQSEYAASYKSAKKDYGEFMGMYNAYMAAGGSLKKDSQKGKMAQLSKDPEFLRARQAYEATRTALVTDKQKVTQGLTGAESAKADLSSGLYNVRSVAAQAKASKKQAELNTVLKSIDDAVSTIMTVAKIASTATTGILSLDTGGMDMSQLVESSPTIEPGVSPGTTPSLAPPDARRFMQPGSDLNPAPSSPEDGLGQPGDTRTYSMPSQTVANAKGLAGKGVDLAGGPDKLLKSAITMLEQANLDKIQGEIDAANEDANLNAAAASAKGLEKKRLDYQKALTTLQDNVTNLADHKKQMDNAVNAMVAAAKKDGAGKDLTGSIRLVASADKFLSQVAVTKSLGQQQQQQGTSARTQRSNINFDPSSQGTAQGPGQLHYWTVSKQSSNFVATKQLVELKAGGKDSLTNAGASNSTQFDVGQSLQELGNWETDVKAKQAQAEAVTGMGNAAGTSSN
jgi:Domain of unknown function (DUF4157)